ncbi:MAG TPA: PilZ domain-containing protein [Candidatus Brocadiia bacterium]|nr:PilZ domain-containing protein [Candidatus Brocadiia bacterium]
MMDQAKQERAYERRPAAETYVEYAPDSSALARLLRCNVQRGLVIDLCKTGVRFRAGEGLKPGDKLDLTICLAGSGQTARVRAIVRWVQAETWSGLETYSHVAGAQFVECSAKAWSVLQDALR